MNEKLNDSYFSRIIADAIRPLRQQYDEVNDKGLFDVIEDLDESALDSSDTKENIQKNTSHNSKRSVEIIKRKNIDFQIKAKSSSDRIDSGINSAESKIDKNNELADDKSVQRRDKTLSESEVIKNPYYKISPMQEPSIRKNSVKNSLENSSDQLKENIETVYSAIPELDSTPVYNSSARPILHDIDMPTRSEFSSSQEYSAKKDAGVVVETLIAEKSNRNESQNNSVSEQHITPIDQHKLQKYQPLLSQQGITKKLHIGQVNIKVIDTMQHQPVDKPRAFSVKKVDATSVEKNSTDSRTFLRTL